MPGKHCDSGNYILQNGGRVAGVAKLGGTDKATILPPSAENIKGLEEIGTAPQNGAVFISKDSGLSNPSSKGPVPATAPATYATIEQQAQTARKIDDFSAKVQSAGLETDAAQDVVAAYADMAQTQDRQSAAKLETTVKRAAEQKAEIDADLNVTKLELEASLEAPYAALQSATAETVAAAQARYDRAVRIAQAKLDAARVKAKNKAATINDSIAEAAENLRQNTVQKQQQSATMQAAGRGVGNEGAGKTTLADWADKTGELAKTSPIKIPGNATIKADTKAAGYDQISYKWTDSGYNYEARWHTKTPGAPAGQGNTWVVSRVTQGNPTGQRRVIHIMVGNTWVTRHEWQTAIMAYQNGTMTAAQEAMLKAGHWLAP